MKRRFRNNTQRRSIPGLFAGLALFVAFYLSSGYVQAQGASAPTNDNPVITTAFLNPRTAVPGQQISATVRATMAPGWYIYALDPTYTFTTTEYSARLPEHISAAGEWQRPGATPLYADPNILIWNGDARFVQPLALSEQISPGVYEIEIHFRYQTCKSTICLPPKTVTRTLKLNVELDGFPETRP